MLPSLAEPLPSFLPEGTPGVRVIVLPNPFRSDRMTGVVPTGWTITDIIEAAGIEPVYRPMLRVWVNEDVVPRDWWGRVKPKPGALVSIRPIPRGGGGGGGGKSPMRMVLILAVMVVAAIAAGPLAAGLGFTNATAFTVFGEAVTWMAIGKAVVAGVLTMVGTALVNALVPPPSPSTGSDGGFSAGAVSAPTLSITGIQNQAAPYRPIPLVLGRRRVFPTFGARFYSEMVGNDKYWRYFFTVGYGPLKLEEFKIGDTPVSAFEDVEMEVRQGYPDDEPHTLYTKEIREEQLNILLTAANGWQQRTTRPECDEIITDFGCPRGLTTFGSGADRIETTVRVEVQYSPAGQNVWAPPVWEGTDAHLASGGLIVITDNSTSPVSRGGRWKVPKGQYDVRFRRITADATSSQVLDIVYATMLRSVKSDNPVKIVGESTIVLRIREGGQLSGLIQSFNLVATSILPDWDQATQTWVERETRSPSAMFRTVLCGPSNKRAVASTRLHLASLQNWAEACGAQSPQNDGPMWTFDAVIDNRTTARELLHEIAAAGRAAFTMIDGKFGVVRDVPQTVPVQNFTPRNSWGYRGTKTFPQLPHGLKVRYIDPEFWDQAEVTVYADGYNEDGSGGKIAASLFEVLDLMACTSKEQAWREGRYHLAVAKLRPETHEIYTDIENLRCTLGDLVMLSHDVAMIGQAFGRVKQVYVNDDGNVEAVQVDETVVMEDGKSYSTRFRLRAGTNIVIGIQTISGEQDVLEFTTPVPLAQSPQKGDLFQFGEPELEAAPMLVKAINRGPNLTAKLTLIPASPEVHDADKGEIPEFKTYLTAPTSVDRIAPPPPVVATVKSDETLLIRLANGSLIPRIVVTFQPPVQSQVSADTIEAQYRRVGAQTWMYGGVYPATGLTAEITSVEELAEYDLRFRTRKGALASDWTDLPNYSVIGRTTPPPDVVNIRATRRADGVQLSWDPASHLDIVGYEIREGTSWGAGTVVTTRHRGTTLFVALVDANDHTFHIRAVDELGLMSQSAATVTASVVPPGDVVGFDVIPQGEAVRLSWRPLPDSVEYEIRAGESWALGRLVGRSAGDHLVALWPVRAASDEVFWCKAVSAAGLHSANAAYTTTKLAPLSDRNVVLARDWKALGWPGVAHGLSLTSDGWLALTSLGGRGEYYEHINLGRSYRARNWIDLRVMTISEDPTTWDGADFSWDWAEAERPWLVTGETDGRRVSAQIALPSSPPSTLLEGFRLAGSTTGIRGALPLAATGIAYQQARFGQGLLVEEETHVAWAVSVPDIFSVTFTLRAYDEAASVELFSLRGLSGGLRFGWDAEAEAFYIEDAERNRVTGTIPWLPGDILAVGISQTASGRELHIASLRTGLTISASGVFGPDGPFDECHVFGSAVPRSWAAAGYDWDSDWSQTTWEDADGAGATWLGGMTMDAAQVTWGSLMVPWGGGGVQPLVIADIAIWSIPLDGPSFVVSINQQAPLGFSSFREVLPGDYEYAEAYVALKFDGTGTGDVVAVEEAVLNIDVPDLQDRGASTVAQGGEIIAFTKVFHAPPEVQVTVCLLYTSRRG